MPLHLVETADPVYAPGQVWAYHTRPGEEGSTLTVLRVERIVPADAVVVHVAVDGLAIRNPRAPGGLLQRASHLPFAREAIDRSVVRLLREGAALPDLDEAGGGYAEWRRTFIEGRGGIFTITVAESVALVDPAARGGAGRAPDDG